MQASNFTQKSADFSLKLAFDAVHVRYHKYPQMSALIWTHWINVINIPIADCTKAHPPHTYEQKSILRQNINVTANDNNHPINWYEA